MNKIRDHFPSEDRIFEWIEGLCRLPHRRTGSPEGLKAMNYVKAEFEKIGLENISIEEADSATYEIIKHRLYVNGEEINCFPINGTLHPEVFGQFKTGDECLDAEMIYLGEGREEDFEGCDVTGKIVLCDCPWFDMDEDIYADKWGGGKAFVFDPDREKREVLRKTDSYSPNAWPYNYIMAQKKRSGWICGNLK